MSSLAELPELVGFFSYSREDDEAFKGTLSALREGIHRELSAQLGRSKKTFRLWQDHVAIAPGKLWESEIKKAIEESFFFIPIVTPRSVSSKYCKLEFESFLAREKAIGRSDLIFPILYISVSALENEAKWRDDPVLSTIGRRQYVDWRPLRHLDGQTAAVREQIERLCQKIVEALNEPWAPPEQRRRMEEVIARQQAEEEARRLDAEARRSAEEEERGRLEAEARLTAEQDQVFAAAKRADTVDAIDTFLRDHPESGHATEAQTLRAALVARDEARRDAMASDDPAVLKTFLKTYRSGPPANQVRDRLRQLEPQKMRPILLVAAAAALLFLIGLGGYGYIQSTVTAEKQRVQAAAEAEAKRKADEAEQQRLAAKAEQDRQAKAAAEAEARRKADEAERQRLAAKAEQDRQAKATAEAEAKRKADEAERQRLAAKAEQDRQAKAAAEAEAKRKADEAEQQRLAAKAEQERLARVQAEAEAKRKADEAERQRLAAKAEQERQAKAAAEADARRKADELKAQPQLTHSPSINQTTPVVAGDLAKGVSLIYAPWTKFCLTGKDAGAKQVCFTGKDGRIESGQPVIAAVIIEPEGESKKILRVTLPLGVQLVHGTRVIVDANAPMQSPYVICFANGCMSDYDVTPDFLANLKMGKNLVVQAINTNGAPLTLPLPLQEAGSGFAKAYDGPPTDAKVFEESQKKLQEDLEKRAAEARKKL
jgi:invasion protein IalB